MTGNVKFSALECFLQKGNFLEESAFSSIILPIHHSKMPEIIIEIRWPKMNNNSYFSNLLKIVKAHRGKYDNISTLYSRETQQSVQGVNLNWQVYLLTLRNWSLTLCKHVQGMQTRASPILNNSVTFFDHIFITFLLSKGPYYKINKLLALWLVRGRTRGFGFASVRILSTGELISERSGTPRTIARAFQKIAFRI